MKKLSQDQQNKIVLFVSECFQDYKNRMETYRTDMEDIYKAVNEFKRLKAWSKATDKDALYDFLVNKAFEVENKVMPKVFANNPNRIVTYKPTYKWSGEADPNEMADMVRDHLYELYKKQDIREVLKLLAKGWIRYGNWYVKVEYKYNYNKMKERKEEVEYDELGNEIVDIVDNYKEDVIDEYPCIDYKSWADIYYDPRYLRLEDFPWIIEVADKVRLSYFTKDRKRFINTELIADACIKDWEDISSYKTRLFQLTWIQTKDDKIIRPTTLNVKKYYGYYDLQESNDLESERLYEFRTVDDTFVVYAKEISQLPFEDFRVFLDTETYYAKWYLQSIIGLQNQLNHQKITLQEYLNKVLYPPMIRSPNSGIDPRQGNPWPGAIIVTSKDAQTAIDNFVQFPFRDIPPAYRQNQNDIERQIQAWTFTIDTSNTLNQQALTNTATWAKIKEFESNAVTGDTRKQFEDTMVRIWYKLLQEMADKMEWNIKVKKKDGTWYWDVNPEAFKDALSKYEIRIEAWSSSYDSVENRRDEALAKLNLSIQALQAWVPVDIKARFEDAMSTFEWVDTTKLFVQQIPWIVNTNLPNQLPNAITSTI